MTRTDFVHKAAIAAMAAIIRNRDTYNETNEDVFNWVAEEAAQYAVALVEKMDEVVV